MPKLPTVADDWQSFWLAVAPANAPPVQEQEMRRAFYAGCWAMLQTCEAIGADDVSEEAGVAILEELDAECRRFQQDMLAGKV